LVGTELFQKTLGVIGCGNIGEAVALRALAFGMKVITSDPVRPPEEIIGCGVEPVHFETLLAESDIITMHVPRTESTKHMINTETISKMKDGVLIICAARGGVIDEQALLAALDSGKVAGAGLDVFETEPPGSSPLPMHPKVVGTPHIGAQTKEAQLRAGYDILSEVVAVLDGQPLRWKIV
jgi:D-3-phosphoglycerate dehydrogenase / 2-oxoglutarate reductase